MKNFKKLLASALCVSMAAATLSMSAFALTFSDVEDDETVSWAKDSINSMTDKGYIKGYEDGTFKPQRAVSKIETLILMSRIMGVEEDDYAQSVDWANNAYSATVSAINTTYVDELSYLMYIGAIDLTDLRDYASAANANTSLLRWQAAYLMVKLAGMDDDAQSATLDPDKFSDYDSIPEDARGYVAVAANMGLMKGMGSDDNGKDYFSPETTLTRAQMATLLDRMIENMERTITTGTVESVSDNGYKLTVSTGSSSETFEDCDGAAVKLDGVDTDIEDLETDGDVMVTSIFSSPYLIEAVTPEITETSTVYGIVSTVSDNSNGQQITIKDSENTDDIMTYTLASDCSIDIKGTKGAFGDLKAGNSVKLTVSGDTALSISVTDKNTTATGLFESIETDSGNNTYLYAEDEDSGESTRYILSSESVTVTRNGATSSLRELAEGDSLSMSLVYGKVTEIKATSETSNEIGTIKEIVLSDKPSITLEIDGKEYSYYMTTSTEVTVNNAEGTIYDLRPGNAATIVADGSTISSITSSATASLGKTSVSGKVASINTTLKVLTVTNSNDSTETVYYDSSTTFLKSNGKSATYKDVVEGTTINATGSDSTGYFVATIIIID